MPALSPSSGAYEVSWRARTGRCPSVR